MGKWTKAGCLGCLGTVSCDKGYRRDAWGGVLGHFKSADRDLGWRASVNVGIDCDVKWCLWRRFLEFLARIQLYLCLLTLNTRLMMTCGEPKPLAYV
jgi:hypothetical protein